jgi:hypothetical protein
VCACVRACVQRGVFDRLTSGVVVRGGAVELQSMQVRYFPREGIGRRAVNHKNARNQRQILRPRGPRASPLASMLRAWRQQQD